MSVFVIQFLTQHKVHACAVSNCGVLLFLLFVCTPCYFASSFELYFGDLHWLFQNLGLKKHSLQENALCRNV